MTNSIPNLIVDTLYYGNSVLLPSVGVLSIQRNASQIMSDGYTIAPPYDLLVLNDQNSADYNIEIAQIIAETHQIDYNIAYNCWNEYLDMEAGDNVLTIENLAMIDIANCELLAIDPNFAQFLSPDNEIQTLQPIVQTDEYIQAPVVHKMENPQQDYNHFAQKDSAQQQDYNHFTQEASVPQQYSQNNYNNSPNRKYKKSYTKQTSTLLATIITLGAALYIAYYLAVKNNII